MASHWCLTSLGGQLPALIGEMDTFDATPSQEDALKGYIVMSRVESANNIAIAQPFSPTLFRQGRLRNAELLLEVLRGQVKADELPERWEAIETQRRQRQGKLADQKFVCGICVPPLPVNAYALVQETKHAESIQEWILKPGTSRCCRKCLRGEKRADAGALVQTYLCKGCKKTRAMKYFTKKHVLSLVELDEVQELVCYDCKDEGEDATKEVYCSGCKKKKPLDTFLAVTRKWMHKKIQQMQEQRRLGFTAASVSARPASHAGLVRQSPCTSDYDNRTTTAILAHLHTNPSNALCVRL